VINKKTKKNGNYIKPACMVSIPYIKGLSEKFKRIMNSFNIKTVLKTTKYQTGTLKKKETKEQIKRQNTVYM
jgi:tripartite-type tricarboxylate transporter receptor subunit TctC